MIFRLTFWRNSKVLPMKKIAIALFLVIVFQTSGICNQLDPNFLSKDTSAVSITAMTFNIRVDTILDVLNRWSNRRQVVVDILTNDAPDVFGLQEAMHSQVEQIQKALPQYKNFAQGRDDGNLKGETCAIFYRKDRFVLEEGGTFWFSDTPTVPGSKGWGNIFPRICTWVCLFDKETQKAFYVFNVHLDNFSQNSRAKSATLLAKQVAARKTLDPFIVMGDFNMELNNSAMVFLENINRKSPNPRMTAGQQSLHLNPSGIGTKHNFLGLTNGPEIDQILTGLYSNFIDISIDHRAINGRYPSDHFPVIAKIIL